VPNLKLGTIADDRPVRLTVQLPASVHRMLLGYAELHGRQTGQVLAVDKLIPAILERFMTTDRPGIPETDVGAGLCGRARWVHSDAIAAGAPTSMVPRMTNPTEFSSSDRAVLQNKTKPSFVLGELPYAENALEPLISAGTLALHHGKHHAGYVTKLNELVDGTSYAGQPLEAVVVGAAKDAQAKAIFDNAAQVWNHDFYWRSMRPSGGDPPEGRIKSALERDLGGEAEVREAFAKSAADRFGSGWVWLVARKDGRIEVTATGNADTPLTWGKVPLLAIDVWEHAYYLDYHNRRADYVAAWLGKLVDWRFADQNLRAMQRS
jgi:superoxide dismutase, Fe-Mn family